MFFNEISLAPDDTRSAVLGILEERRQGNVEIPDNWIVVAAGNRPEDLSSEVKIFWLSRRKASSTRREFPIAAITATD